MGVLKRVLACLIGAAVVVAAGTTLALGDEHPKPATIQGVTDVGATSVRVHGAVHPGGGASVSYHFEYGPTDAYGSQTATATVETTGWQAVAATIEGLAPSTTYHVRLVATSKKGTSRSPDHTFTTAAEGETPGGGGSAGGPGQPGAELGASVGAKPARGRIFVRAPGQSSFAPLADAAAVPLGAEIDARRGQVAITAELPSGEIQTGVFGGGRFVVRQADRHGYLDLHLRGPYCKRRAARGSAVASASRRSRGRSRKLWGRDRGGRFRTHGRHSHATVRGTRWLVEDRCDGTLTRVTAGSVVVREKADKRRVVLKAGERYLARPRR
jgi:hypothetical protein